MRPLPLFAGAVPQERFAMRWTISLIVMLILAAAGCGGEAAPPKGSEDSATSLDVEVEAGDAKEDASKEESPKADAAPATEAEKSAEEKPAEAAKAE